MLNRREVISNSKSWLKRPAQKKSLKEVITEEEVANSRSLSSEKYWEHKPPQTGATGIFIFSDNLKLCT